MSVRSALKILPVHAPQGPVTADDGPRPDTGRDKPAALPPAFRPGGAVTAGNSCSLNDGAEAAVLVDEQLAERRGLPVRARILGTAVSGVDPALMGVGRSMRSAVSSTGQGSASTRWRSSS
ncbi:hypothetical protein [Streptomyces sp. NPDC017993]|uniref:thiolase family protein n=1 Tax=Streptomyces sp. NPDC017993 TaxID=3365027 RepID=UPI0037ADFD3D